MSAENRLRVERASEITKAREKAIARKDSTERVASVRARAGDRDTKRNSEESYIAEERARGRSPGVQELRQLPSTDSARGKRE